MLNDVRSCWASYLQLTPPRMKIIDAYMVYCIASLCFQLVFVMFGPATTTFGAIFSSLGSFVLAGSFPHVELIL